MEFPSIQYELNIIKNDCFYKKYSMFFHVQVFEAFQTHTHIKRTC